MDPGLGSWSWFQEPAAVGRERADCGGKPQVPMLPQLHKTAALAPTPGSLRPVLCHSIGCLWSVEAAAAGEPPAAGRVGDPPSFSGVGWDSPQLEAP